jgi:serine/threonine protein phosphatase PrpC
VRIAGFEVGYSVRAADGFAAGGDAVVARNGDGGRLVLAVIDVLGHGPQAHAVAVKAEAALAGSENSDVTALLALLDEALAGPIGAAAAIVVLEPDSGMGQFVGVGNTVARALGRSERRLVSVDGIVGQSHRSPSRLDFTLGVGDILLLHTDGISSHFDRSQYPQLPTEDVEVGAREMIRRFGRTYDDAACLIVRRPPP